MIVPTLALFPMACRSDQRLFVTSRRGLQAISEEIETTVIDQRVRTRVFVGFQKLSFFLSRVDRYHELAKIADGVWVFGLPDVEPPAIAGVTYVPLTETHALTREWAVVVDAPEYFGALVAEDLSGFGVPNRLRRFRGVWTFDETLVNRLQRTLSDALGVPPLAAANSVPRDFRQQLRHIGRLTDRLVETLEQRNQALVQLQQLREDLTRLLVHDLRTPLTAIVGALELVEFRGDRFSPERRAHFIRSALRSARSLNNMISNLLDLARLEEGKLTLAQTRLDPGELLQAAADLARPIVEQENKHITVEIPERLPAVLGDADKLARVLNNLVSNALKYTHPNGHITLTARAGAGAVEFAVSDDGQGIPTEALGRLFTKFEQAGGRGQRPGTGLGLYFCRMIVEAHGGSIRVESELGKGSTFRFSLPQHA